MGGQPEDGHFPLKTVATLLAIFSSERPPT
jgi:hypothetical protein